MTEAEAAQVFLTRLHEEKLRAQERRGILIQRKVVWLTGLFAVGAIELPLGIGSTLILYLLPLVALIFDLYVMGEDYGIKRMGTFVRLQHEGTPDADWEEWLRAGSKDDPSGKRDAFARWALRVGSVLVLLGSALLLGLTGVASPVFFWSWFMASLGLLVAAYWLNRIRLSGLDKLLPEPPKASNAAAGA